MPLTNEEARTLTDAELLDVIVEEAAEVIQAATKAKRFGILDVNPNKPGAKPNAVNIGLETKQLERLVRVLGERYGVVYNDLDAAVEAAAREQLAHGVGFSYRQPQPVELRARKAIL